MTRTLLIFAAAALCEIAGCFAVWAWWRLERSALWLIPGAMALGLFAWLLAQVSEGEQVFAGRAFAAYGAVYIAASLGWLWAVEGVRPQSSDLAGAALALAGAGVLVWGQLRA